MKKEPIGDKAKVIDHQPFLAIIFWCFWGDIA
jgi:hypothetical protein